jgi:hypothetical protein
VAQREQLQAGTHPAVTPLWLVVAAWSAVAFPLGWGVGITLAKSMALFR